MNGGACSRIYDCHRLRPLIWVALRRQGSQVRILKGAPVNKKWAPCGPIFFYRCVPPRETDVVRQIAPEIWTERRSREPEGPKQPLGCFRVNPVGRAIYFRADLERGLIGRVAKSMPQAVNKE